LSYRPYGPWRPSRHRDPNRTKLTRECKQFRQSVSRTLEGPSRACRDWGVEVFANADLAAVFLLVARWYGRHCRAAATPLEPFLVVGAFVAILVHVWRSDHARAARFISESRLASPHLLHGAGAPPISKDARCGSPGDADQATAGKLAEQA
jgi:hypothetical protein